MNYALKVYYDGSHFAGFQRQSQAETVQSLLEQHLSRLFQEPIEICSAGRTDKGVHAVGQVIGFRSQNHRSVQNIVAFLNGALGGKVGVLEAAQLADDSLFHPRFSAFARTYSYKVLCGCNLASHHLWSSRLWCVGQSIDPTRLQLACDLFVGEHDFTTFSAPNDSPSQVRIIQAFDFKELCWPAEANHSFFVFTITANGFLRRMVRFLMAGVIEVGLGLRTQCNLEDKLRLTDRRFAPHPAPAAGLYFETVHYKHDPFSPNSEMLDHHLARRPAGVRFKR